MARAPISVVIPTLNVHSDLGPCLGALGEGLAEGLIREVIISDGGSTDGTQSLAEQAGATLVSGPASRGGQLRRGCEAAKGDWLLIIHADSILKEGWTGPVLSHLTGAPDKAGVFRLKFRANGLWPRSVAGWANLRTRLFHLPYGDQGLLISRKLYDQVEGYDDIPLMEDVALARRLRGQVSVLPATVLTSAERYERDGWARRSLNNFITVLRYFAGASPETLAKSYTRKKPRV